MSWLTRQLARLPRPLDPLRSFKLKVSLLVAGSLVSAALAFWAGAAWQFRYGLLTAVLVALVVTQFLANGMTSPLREMTAAAKAMARGDYSRRIRSSSRDEIGELAVAFNQMSSDLGAADQYRRELIANVSHELRTPISALQGMLENIVDGLSEPDRPTMQAALSQTERLGRLVAELLDLSRLDGGAVPLRRSRFEVEPFLADAVAQAGLAASAEARATVAIDVQPTSLTASADTARLHQVVANLLDNAFRHGREVRVRARPLDQHGGLLLEVIDDGPGIPVPERRAVFERFTQGGSRDGSTGLGLAIARWVVELHGGSIAVVGDEPGCRIQVALPATQ